MNVISHLWTVALKNADVFGVYCNRDLVFNPNKDVQVKK